MLDWFRIKVMITIHIEPTVTNQPEIENVVRQDQNVKIRAYGFILGVFLMGLVLMIVIFGFLIITLS
jgi:tetrahydromethanopterin S-methyltransferase subunit B